MFLHTYMTKLGFETGCLHLHIKKMKRNSTYLLSKYLAFQSVSLCTKFLFHEMNHLYTIQLEIKCFVVNP